MQSTLVAESWKADRKLGYDVPSKEFNNESLIYLLPMYASSQIMIKQAIFKQAKLFATFRTFRHPFTIEDAKHLTREHILLYITQASYIFVTSLCESQPDWPFDVQRFRAIGLSEQAVFTKIEMNFRRLIPNKDGASLCMYCIRERVMENRVFLRLAFEFEEGCYGTCEGFIVTDESLRPGVTQFV